MKIYKVYMCLRLVLGRLKSYRLEEYSSNEPIIFVPCDNPDQACHEAYMGLYHKIISQGIKKKGVVDETEILHFSKEILQDVRVLHVRLANEEKL